MNKWANTRHAAFDAIAALVFELGERVLTDGELVFEKKMIGRYPDPDDVLPLVRERLAG